MTLFVIVAVVVLFLRSPASHCTTSFPPTSPSHTDTDSFTSSPNHALRRIATHSLFLDSSPHHLFQLLSDVNLSLLSFFKSSPTHLYQQHLLLFCSMNHTLHAPFLSSPCFHLTYSRTLASSLSNFKCTITQPSREPSEYIYSRFPQSLRVHSSWHMYCMT